MNLGKFLSENLSSIVGAWRESIYASYPPQTASLLKNKKDQFDNPVGYAIREGTDGLVKELLKEGEIERFVPFLDRIIRVRAIQEFTPAQALSFVLALKQVIRDQLKAHRVVLDEDDARHLAELDQEIDRMGLLAFNVYVQCRERLFQIRLDEFKARTYRLLQKADLLAEIPDWHAGGSA
jgi:hypothetical protein